jgi:flagellar P-ring protein precursor FlgI
MNRMFKTTRRCSLSCALGASVALLLATAMLTPPAHAVQVQDLVRLKGSETNKLVGMGLVVGLQGTGDGGKFLPAMRALAEVIGRLNDEGVVASELADSRNVALVTISCELPGEGVREGDRLDVHVAAIGPARSLAGGRLFMVPLIGPQQDSPVLAYAEGPIVIENPQALTVGRVPRGAQLTADVMSRLMDRYGRITLVINPQNASWPVANNLANLINDLIAPDGPRVARAIDAKNVILEVPMWQRDDPAQFISPILQTYLDPSQVSVGGRVVINERTGTIVISGDVQVSPVIISHRGLTITTITPPPVPNAAQPIVQQHGFVGIDPDNRGGAKLADLLAAFNQLKVPAEDRIEILKLMHESGKLHARLILE